MTRMEAEFRRCKNGMIDYDHYRRVAATARQDCRTAVFSALIAAVRRYFRLPQKRWMRRQASSRSSVFVA